MAGIDESLRSVSRPIVGATLLLLFVLPILLLATGGFAGSPLVRALLVGGWVLVGALVVRRVYHLWSAGRDGGAAGGDETGNSVWDAIPSWQYDGRHAESGGLARSEQEQSLREIQRKADAETGRTRRTNDR